MSSLTLPQARIAIGWAQVNGQRVSVEVDPEWMRYFAVLQERVGGVVGPPNIVQYIQNTVASAAVMGDGDAGGGDDGGVPVPGPQGLAGSPGAQGPAGPALFLLNDAADSDMPMAMAAATSPGGLTTQILFNNAGVSAGSANLYVNVATGQLFTGLDAMINAMTVGHGAGSGTDSTAVGEGVLGANTIGNSNTAMGYYAMSANTTGVENTAMGVQALLSNLTGQRNTAVGRGALQASDSNDNTAVGYHALDSVTSGTNNVAIGFEAGTDVMKTLTTESNRIVLGNDNHTNAYIKVAWTVVSDARDKTEFAPVPHGLGFVLALRPTSYRLRVSRDSTVPSGRMRYGFKAQDILALEGQMPVVIDDSDPKHLKYNESSLIPILVNAIQDLKADLDNLRKAIHGS